MRIGDRMGRAESSAYRLGESELQILSAMGSSSLLSAPSDVYY